MLEKRNAVQLYQQICAKAREILNFPEAVEENAQVEVAGGQLLKEIKDLKKNVNQIEKLNEVLETIVNGKDSIQETPNNQAQECFIDLDSFKIVLQSMESFKLMIETCSKDPRVVGSSPISGATCNWVWMTLVTVSKPK